MQKVPFDQAANPQGLARAHRVLRSTFGVGLPVKFAHEAAFATDLGPVCLRKSSPRRLSTVPNYFIHATQGGPILAAGNIWNSGAFTIHFNHRDFLDPADADDARIKQNRGENGPHVRADGSAGSEQFMIEVLRSYLQNVLPAAREGSLKAGGTSVAERRVLRLVRRTFPGEQIRERWRGSEWLEGLELDVYLPQRHFAIEVQGDQHFMPVWGGEDREAVLEQIQHRDRDKVERCAANAVVLLRLRERATFHATDEELSRVIQAAVDGEAVQDWPSGDQVTS